jgi:N-acetylglutamate synthase-like GNAT family acetyltransferase
MDIIPPTTSAGPIALPEPRVRVTVRAATAGDLPFIDSLQKMHTKQVGWMPTQQLQGKIEAGHVIVAEESSGEAVGYCIGHDRYFKRDDVGIIYQVNVAPGRQRGLIGAALVHAMFGRAAYGCRLFCCWCAQDIEANHFWESLGFLPLAFRAGSREKGRLHIFWQRRIVAGDTATPYWFPAQTNAGSIREDRLVLPIPPGTHWRDVMPVLLPGATGDNGGAKQLPPPRERRKAKDVPVAVPATLAAGGLRMAAAKPAVAPEPKAKREPKPKVKNDPKLVAAARELRDRWLERVNAGEHVLARDGKYDVSRALVAPSLSTPVVNRPAALLPAA